MVDERMLVGSFDFKKWIYAFFGHRSRREGGLTHVFGHRLTHTSGFTRFFGHRSGREGGLTHVWGLV